MPSSSITCLEAICCELLRKLANFCFPWLLKRYVIYHLADLLQAYRKEQQLSSLIYFLQLV
jgi:hypothetical protein